MPLTAPLTSPDPYTIKFCSDESFKNTCKHEASGQFFSIPPDTRDQDQRTPTQGLIDRLETVKRGILGVEAADKVKIDEYRVCWYAHPSLLFSCFSHFPGWHMNKVRVPVVLCSRSKRALLTFL